ncbi:DUF882 domain-containing protein [Desulfosarcina ovata]|uniref:Murein endopeptidase K n=2 Tax=Desulfosarcina ovata TaxID=83564 RepID=A0A5K8ABW1_9BACT|nr:DUF882 domain-containing protein [Desulfosarcina ovata]BBO83546.1 twin-arginine translocation pathway signal [Desulfosarcina ovata subsp. sediminis]BBO89989.1 twin-arginine translocation pathway signal [Desulfosarcina ovata subsp. ovata]
MDRCSRRNFLKIGGGFLASCLVPSLGLASLHPDRTRRSLSFFNTHTDEQLSVCYFNSGAYCPEALNRINHLLRDHRTGEIHPIDPRLMDLLFGVNQRLGCSSSFHIISGYRSPKTNTMLRKKSFGVAKRSYHMQGRAIDIRLPDCDTHRLRQACIDLKAGGVGYYPRSDFVHVDTGAFRTWNG